MRAALEAGATKAEIVEVLCLSSTLGIHACNIGVPILFEVLREEGRALPEGMDGMTEQQWELRREFEKKRGYWHAFWEDFLRLSPEFFGAYVEFSSVPWVTEGGGLEPKVCALFLSGFCCWVFAGLYILRWLVSSHTPYQLYPYQLTYPHRSKN